MTSVFGNADQASAGDGAGEAQLPGASENGPPGHEQVVFCQDPPTGLKAIIAIHSTALGPSLGGTRFYPYQSESAALADVLSLSRAMTYKNALAGLDLGGGKAVIIGDPDRLKSEALLRAYGRFVQSLNGRYITACDIGTYPADMDVIARETGFVAACTEAHGGGGDPSPMAAYGVFQGMRAAAEHVWGTPNLDGRTVGIEGVGKVGRALVDMLIADGARLVIYDVNAAAVATVHAVQPAVRVAPSRDDLLAGSLDVYAPCALGGTVDDALAETLQARIICGSANSQLAHPGVEKLLAERGIVYAPDYLVNSGGVIQVADERTGFRYDRAKARVEQIFYITKNLLATADKEGVPPAVAADRLAERRISEVGRLRRFWLNG